MISELTELEERERKSKKKVSLKNKQAIEPPPQPQTHREIAPHEACRRLTDLVAHDPPITNLSFSIALSLYLNL